jgi:hypothetical protein
MKLVKLTIAAAALATGFAVSASAMPVTKLGTEATAAPVEKTALVCNRWGHCWHTGWHRGYAAYGYGGGWHRGWHHGWHGGWHHRHW